MKRPILIATLGFIIGIIWGLYFNIALFILVSFIIVSMLIILNKKYKNLIRVIKLVITKKVLVLSILCFLIGNLYIKYLENDYKEIYNSLSDVDIVGTIISEKEDKQYSDMYIIKTENINGKKVNSKRFYLSVNKNKYKMNIKYGNKVHLKGEYIKPTGQRNYKGFDYSNYLKSLKIYGTIKLSGKIKIVKENNINFIFLISNDLRNKIIQNVDKIFPEETKGVFLGILLGYTNLIQDEVKENFSDSSLSHLLAVSGAHVSYVVLGVGIFLKILKIPKKIKNILICTFLIFYLFLINFTPSVTRAVIMSIMVIMQLVLYRKQDTATTISFSSAIILISNPYSLFNIGFLLSYFGTIGIIVFIDKIKDSKESKNKLRQKLKNICIVTISAQILILPVMVYYFNTISLTFIISNLVAGLLMEPITLIGLIIILSSFISIQITSLIVKFYNVLLVILLNTTKIISNIPISKIYAKTPYIISIIIYYIIVFITLIILNIKKSDRKILKQKLDFNLKKLKHSIIKHKNKIFILIIFILIFSILYSRILKKLKIYFIDVGQGDSCLIVTPQNKKILIDSGGSEDYDVGKNTLLPYLLDRRITSLDYILISHFDSDHCKGFEYLLENIKVKNIIFSKQVEFTDNFNNIKNIADRRKVKSIVVKKGDILKIDKYSSLQILSPAGKNSYTDINDASIVAKFMSYNFRILFTGDASQKIEEELVNDNKIKLKSDVLKVSHHGSKTGNKEEFLEKVKPKIALIGVGEKNKFGHPNQVVIERLKAIKAKIYRTDQMGEIEIVVDKNRKIKISKKINATNQ